MSPCTPAAVWTRSMCRPLGGAASACPAHALFPLFAGSYTVRRTTSIALFISRCPLKVGILIWLKQIGCLPDIERVFTHPCSLNGRYVPAVDPHRSHQRSRQPLRQPATSARPSSELRSYPLQVASYPLQVANLGPRFQSTWRPDSPGGYTRSGSPQFFFGGSIISGSP